MLTELEGAILTEIGFRARHTAFKVRQAFRESPSSDWQGSAGSVYPAIRRLTERGLIEMAAPQDGRGTRLLSLTPDGRAALLDWTRDSTMALSIGMDPFRLRAGLWTTMAHSEQLAHAEHMLAMTEQAIVSLTGYKLRQDKLEAIQVELAIALQESRIRWIRNWLTELRSAG